MAATASIRQQLQWASEILYAISCSSRLDSEVLLAYCLNKERSYLFTWPDKLLTEDQQTCFRELVKRRLKPEPVAYLVGYREFYSMSFTTTPATLVPRPETEMLVDMVLQKTEGNPAARILELGTGTGAIALAIKRNRPACSLTATDVSSSALDVARINASRFGLDIELVRTDWYSAIATDVPFDVIVSNPPYIAAHDPYLSQGDLPAEPRSALCSGPSGLEALEQIIAGAGARLRNGGFLVLEHGYDQGGAVRKLLDGSAFVEIETYRDFNGLDRMTCARISQVR